MASYVYRVVELWDWLRTSPPAVNNTSITIVSDATTLVVDNVSVVTPNGGPLLRSVSFVVGTGSSVPHSITLHGPSGCGKSTLFRVIAGLIDCGSGGNITRPPTLSERSTLSGSNSSTFVMFIPQRPYIPIQATLLELLTFPHHQSVESNVKNGSQTWQVLSQLLQRFELFHIIGDHPHGTLLAVVLHFV